MKLQYTIEAETDSFQNENILKKLGFDREWDSSPFSFTTDSKSEIMQIIDELDEEGFDLGWILTRRI